MITVKSERQQNILFIGMCCLAYFTSYMTRINYGAAIAEIIYSLGITKTQASMAVTGSFITYGAGQILNGIVGDHIRPRTMIFYGLFISSICNITMSALSNVYIMTVVWCINGFAQSMMWPPMVRIMAENLSSANYKKACMAVSTSSSVATITIYLLAPLCITLSGWRLIFLISASCGLVVGVLWLVVINKLLPAPVSKTTGKETTEEANVRSETFSSLFIKSGLIQIAVIIILMGILRDGITTWMPSYIDDTYHFGTSISILSAAILPIFSIASVYSASYVHKLTKNEVKASALIWVLVLVCSIVLVFVFSSQAIVSIGIMAIITGCMHGVNLMLIQILPGRYKNSGRISTVSGLLNAFTYVGSAISSFGIASLSDNFGWRTTIITWCIVALAGTILSLSCVKKFSS